MVTGIGNNYIITSEGASGRSERVLDATRELIGKKNEQGSRMLFAKNSDGNTIEVNLVSSEGARVLSTMEFNLQGERTQIIEANSGTTITKYNGFGQVYEMVQNGKITEFEYDAIGRLTSTKKPEGIISQTYIESGPAINDIETITNYNGFGVEYQYEQSLGRMIQVTELIGDEQLVSSFQYTNSGQIESRTYPSGLNIRYSYNEYGLLNSILNESGESLWKRESTNAFGNIEEATLGNGLKLKNTFDDYGYLEKTITEDVFEEKLEYSLLNKSRGNVGKRIDLKNGVTESFSYDDLDRLTTIEVNGSIYKQMNFSDNGNIQEQSGLGPYAYDAIKFNAITAIDVQDLAASKIPSFTQDIGYTSFNKAKSIEENGKHLTIDYGFDEERRKVVYEENDQTKWTKYYSLDYEKIVDENNIVTEVSYISSPSGLLMLQVKEGGSSNNYYTHTDYQGNIRVLTNSEGELQYEQRFDPWGNRVAVETYSQDNVTELPKWLRGYTGHEHLDVFGLINMNGRMYDPVVGRMLSPDKYVQEPENIQNYNRYSYALNNPIKYTDPSGWNYSPGMPGSPGYAGGAMGGAAQVAYITLGGAPLKAVSANAHIGRMQIGRWYYDGYGSIKQYVGAGNGEWSFSYVDMREGGQLYSNAFENVSFSSNESGNVQPNIKQEAWLYNFVGPGPNMDPRMIPDPLNKGDFLRPMNDLDNAALKHDISYYENGAGGVSGALFDLSVTEADGELSADAYEVFFNSIVRNKDSVTGKPTSFVTGIQSGYVGALFGTIYIYKSIFKNMGSSAPIHSYY